MQTIGYIFIAALVAAACTSVDASPFGADYGLDEGTATAGRAGEASPDAYPAWLAEVFEHVINPEASRQPLNRKE